MIPPEINVMVLGLRGFPGVEGGVEKHAEHLYPLAVEMGCRITVLSRSRYQSVHGSSWRGISFVNIWAPRAGGWEALLHSLFGVIYAALKRPNILHIHAIGPALVAPLAKLFGLKVVVTHHGADYEREKWGVLARCLLRMGEKWGMKYADQRIVISQTIQKMIYEKYKFDTYVIPNGVVMPEIPKTLSVLNKYSLEPKRYILMVCRYVPEKRHFDLIDGFERARLKDWKLVIVGRVDSNEKYCKSVLSRSDSNPDIIIVGFQSGISLSELYAHAGLFVLPSSHEGLPIALLEALSYGLPVLVSDIPAHKEINLPESKYFSLGNVADLAEKIASLATDQSDQEKRDEYREWVAMRYSWINIVSSTLDIYRRALR